MSEAPVELFLWANGIGTLIALATSVWSFVTSGARANAKVLESHDARLEAVERLTTTLAARVEQAPSRESLHQLELSISTVTGRMEVLGERLETAKAIADRLQEWSMQVGKEGR